MKFASQRGLVPDPVVVRLSPAAPHIDITSTLRRLALRHARDACAVGAAQVLAQHIAQAQQALISEQEVAAMQSELGSLSDEELLAFLGDNGRG